MTTRPRVQWTFVKRDDPKTPGDFMLLVRRLIPAISDADVMAWQRSMTVRQWERDICDFVWLCMQAELDPGKWQTSVEQYWPNIRSIIEQQNIEEAFENMNI